METVVNSREEIKAKLREHFDGKIVRKDLTAMMKRGANVPTFVLEYLLGMYCATDDDEMVEQGVGRIRKILTENYVRADESETISLTFEKGIPVALNGESMKYADILRALNKLGGKHGIGICDIVENRMVGMKSRGVYETPGGTILMEAHMQLEELILDKETLLAKKNIANSFADVVYSAKWFSPLREAYQAFIESTQQYVTGEVKLKLYKGNIIKQGTTSPYSIYNESIASFTTGDLYDHHDASGFITLYGLSTKVRAMKLAEAEKN